MATTIPPLSWTCPQCGQQVPVGQAACPNCAGAGAPPPPAPPQPLADEEEGWFSRYRTLLLIAGALLLLILLFLMVRGCGAQKAPTPQAASAPVAAAPAALRAPDTDTPPSAAPAKPSPMPAKPARAGINRSDLRQEVRRAVEEALRAHQQGQPAPVEVKVNLPEITVRVTREGAASTPSVTPAPPKPRREQLSDRELERRFKERLLAQEP